MTDANQKLVIAVDGGQTSTLALVARLDGTIIACGRGGPSNHYNEPGGPERLESALRTSTQEALESGGQSTDTVIEVCLGMTGLNPHTEVIAQTLFPTSNIQLRHDTITALAGASEGKSGVVVIAGTGTVAYGCLDSGEEARSSGWGYIMGDEGSAYWIGMEAIRAACKTSDGRSKDTTLVRLIPEHLHLNDLRELHQRIYSQEISRGAIASLAKIAADAARAGDTVAMRLLERAGQELAQAALAVIGRLGQLEVGLPVYHTGGVFLAGAVILEPFRATIGQTSPNSPVMAAAFSPVVGSLFLALRAAGVELNSDVLGRVRHSLPPEALLKQSEGD